MIALGGKVVMQTALVSLGCNANSTKGEPFLTQEAPELILLEN